MAEFFYEALDQGGRQVRGAIEAGSEEIIIDKLRDMGYYPLRVTPHRKKSAAHADLTELPLLRNIFHRIKAKHVMTFTRQLATLIDAGLPIIRALGILGEQVESVIFKKKIAAMTRDIEAGASLSEAMARHPKVFDRLYVNMVRAGEVGGVLESVLAKVAEFLEKGQALVSKVKSALMYPIVVMTLASAIVSVILIFIIPRFEDMFHQLGGELPGPTRILIRASSLLVHQAWIVLLGGALLVFAYRKASGNPRGKYVIDWMKLKLPVFGDLFRKLAIARFAGTLSTLINAGVPILQALDIVRDSSGNEVIARAMADVHQSVKDGETIHQPLAQCDVFPPLVIHMVAVGEETGAIDKMLVKVAEAYEREVDDTVEALTSLLEPLMIVFLGCMVGAIVVALYLPLFNITNVIGKNQ